MRQPPKLPWSEHPVWESVDCGEGWYDIIERLDTDLRAIYPDYRVSQVKEKFGGLRYYINVVPNDVFDVMYDRIRQAEQEAADTYEWCGAAGQSHVDNGWWRTLCNDCHEKLLAGYRPWMATAG